MTLAQYAKANPQCEVLPYFPFGIGSTNHSLYGQKRLIRYSHGQELLVPAVQKSTETHHILGSGNGAKRVNDVTNLIRVCNDSHQWLEAHKLAGQVVCLWTKLGKDEVDWKALSDISGKLFPSCLDTDAYALNCRQFPQIEEFRQTLIRS